MIFAMSDIHAHYDLMQSRVDQIKPFLEDDNKLILLGDYIDRGNESYKCLKLAYDLEQQYGEEKVIVLKGNHEVWFQEFLFEDEDLWLKEDCDFLTSGTFLTPEQYRELDFKPDVPSRVMYAKECIKQNHKELLLWMKKLRLFYETETQIFVHAGVDEDIPEEEMEYCVLGTPDHMLTGKYPPSKGHFYKDVIAGHVGAWHLARDRSWKGIYFDGESHYYIDGSTARTRRLLCLAYDEKQKIYYEFLEDGTFKEIKKRMQLTERVL